MTRANLLVKNLSTVETLGVVNVLCSDKTGTLTYGRMEVANIGFSRRAYKVEEWKRNTEMVKSQQGLRQVQVGLTLCCGAKFSAETDDLPLQSKKILGDATDSNH